MEQTTFGTLGISMLVIGIVGLVAALMVNLLGIFVFETPGSAFFSQQWWSSWFPAYLSWPVFSVLGIVFLIKSNS